MKLFKYILLALVLFLTTSTISAQTFKVTEIEDYSPNISQEKKQEIKASTLGMIIKLEVYSNDVKIIIPDEEPIVLTKIKEDHYQASLKYGDYVLNLTTWIRYIRKGELRVYRKDKIVGKLIFERE